MQQAQATAPRTWREAGSVYNEREAIIAYNPATGERRVVCLEGSRGSRTVKVEAFPRVDYRDNALQAYDCASTWARGATS